MSPQKLPQQMIGMTLVLLLLIGCAAPTFTPIPPTTTPVLQTLSATAVQPSAIPTTPPTETPVPTKTPTPFVPKATIKIVSHGPLTGGYAIVGTDLMRGAELAVKQLTESMMEMGFKVELVTYDDQNDIGVAVANAKEIVADPEILCGVGHYSSRVFVQVQEIYHQAALAFVAPSTTLAFVTANGYPEVNRVVGRNDGQGAAGAQFAKAQGFARVFIISESSDYAQFIAYHFMNEPNRIGVEVVGNMKTDALENFEWLIDRVMATHADLVYFITIRADQGGAFFREARAAGYLGAFLGPDTFDTPALLEFAGPLLIDGGGFYYTTMAAPASDYPEAAGFVVDFETLYGVTPQVYSAQAYDAAAICMRAIQEASNAKAGELPTRAEVATAIRALQDYRGITGIFNFNVNGDPDPARYFVFQVVSADPDDWSQNALVLSFDLAPPK
jgi:branched-chain amino acid transport system substrate-binding protein